MGKQVEYNENTNVKYISKSTKYFDETGEHTMTETNVYKKYYGGPLFYRVWLSDLLYHLGLINNSKQMDVLFYVLDHVNSENLFIGTYRSIEKDTGISYKTIATIFKKMIDTDLISSKQRGVYMVNPTLLMKGDNVRKHKLTIEYENVKVAQVTQQREPDRARNNTQIEGQMEIKDTDCHIA